MSIRFMVLSAVTSALTSTLLALASTAPALAESFVLNGNQALNTNNNFSKVDGQPRMSTWNYSSSDQDQQFDRLPGNRGGTLLKQRSTGKCLNAHYPQNNGLVNVWNCDANDPDQNFNVNSLGSGFVQIKRAGTNLCVDSPAPRQNAGRVLLWPCNPNNANQRFQNFGASVINRSEIKLSEFQVWIIARKPNNSSIPLLNDAGHAWIAIVRQTYTQVQQIHNGTVISTSVVNPEGWQVDTTYGFWPYENLVVNKGSERDQTNQIIRGESISARGFAVRKSRISASRANWIKNGAYRAAGCNTYRVVGGIGGQCNCADYATRQWHILTATWDDFRIRAVTNVTNLTLDRLVDSINKKNKSTGQFLDGGKTWQ